MCSDHDSVLLREFEGLTANRRSAGVEAATNIRGRDERHQLGVEAGSFAQVRVQVDLHDVPSPDVGCVQLAERAPTHHQAQNGASSPDAVRLDTPYEGKPHSSSVTSPAGKIEHSPTSAGINSTSPVVIPVTSPSHSISDRPSASSATTIRHCPGAPTVN